MAKVIDASAVLAFLYNEPGAEKVKPDLAEGRISAVNAAEVLSVLVRNKVPQAAALLAFEKTGLRVVDFSRGSAIETLALVTPAARSRRLSLGDRACLALALAEKLPVVTADGNWSGLSGELQIEQIR
jgi:PIN domain nuclease of toxin-antitoxin system